jgi:hypothetical protein
MNNQECKEHWKKINDTLLAEHPDLKQHPEFSFEHCPIAWLTPEEDFEKWGLASSEMFVRKLRAVCDAQLGRIGTLGYHTCEFCGQADSSEEWNITDREGKKKWHFPDMIFHYIEAHDYFPPIEFIAFINKQFDRIDELVAQQEEFKNDK